MNETGTVLMETVFGSHLYGTSGPCSDRDWKSVVVPPARAILLQRAKPTVVTKTKHDATAKNTAEDVDVETWALHQFFKLVGEGQTVAMDALFSTPDAWVREPHPLWLEIVENRGRMLSRRASSFLGYARQQANRFGIKGSRMAAAEHAVGVFAGLVDSSIGNRTKLSDIEGVLRTAFEGVEHAEIINIETGGGKVLPHLSVCNRKMPFTANVKLAHEVYSKLWQEYGERARQAKENQGVDWKALSHAVRVGRQAVELLDTGHIVFPRPEAGHLLAVKRGDLPYPAVAEEIESLLVEVEAASVRSSLPAEPDKALMDELTVRAYRAEVCREA